MTAQDAPCEPNCPHCGGPAVIRWYWGRCEWHEQMYIYRAECSRCAWITKTYGTQDEARGAWVRKVEAR